MCMFIYHNNNFFMQHYLILIFICCFVTCLNKNVFLSTNLDFTVILEAYS
jgi:hypothetical protein